MGKLGGKVKENEGEEKIGEGKEGLEVNS